MKSFKKSFINLKPVAIGNKDTVLLPQQFSKKILQLTLVSWMKTQQISVWVLLWVTNKYNYVLLRNTGR